MKLKLASVLVDVKSFLRKLKGSSTEKEFYRLTGISHSTAWKMVNLTYSCPPERALVLYKMAKLDGITLSHKDISTLLLGRKLAETLVDLDMVISGTMTLDKWVRSDESQQEQTKVLGLNYSSVFYKRTGKHKKSWPKRAVDIVRRSNYQIDLFDLLGADRKWFV